MAGGVGRGVRGRERGGAPRENCDRGVERRGAKAGFSDGGRRTASRVDGGVRECRIRREGRGGRGEIRGGSARRRARTNSVELGAGVEHSVEGVEGGGARRGRGGEEQRSESSALGRRRHARRRRRRRGGRPHPVRARRGIQGGPRRRRQGGPSRRRRRRRRADGGPTRVPRAGGAQDGASTGDSRATRGGHRAHHGGAGGGGGGQLGRADARRRRDHRGGPRRNRRNARARRRTQRDASRPPGESHPPGRRDGRARDRRHVLRIVRRVHDGRLRAQPGFRVHGWRLRGYRRRRPAGFNRGSHAGDTRCRWDDTMSMG